MDTIAIASVAASTVVALAVLYRDIIRGWYLRLSLEVTFSLEEPISQVDGEDYRQVDMRPMNDMPTSTTTWPWQIEQRK